MGSMITYGGKELALGEAIREIAKDEGIPASGLTILGGKPYINVTGLDAKIRNKCKEDKLALVGVEYVPITQASKADPRAGGWGIIRFFDKPGFEKALSAMKGVTLTSDILTSLKEMYFHVFKMRGYASPETIQMDSLKKIDHIEHMAERRATNRAKREATGTGLTSLDEMEQGGNGETMPPISPTPTKPAPKGESSPPPGRPPKPGTKKPGPQKLEVEAPKKPEPKPEPDPEPHQDPEPPAKDEPSQDAGDGENLIPQGDSGLRPVWIKLVDDSRKGDPAKGEDWQLWGLKVQDENENYYVNTFSETHGALAKDIKTKAVWANIVWEWARDKKTGEKKLFKGKPSRNLVYIEEAQG